MLYRPVLLYKTGDRKLTLPITVKDLLLPNTRLFAVPLFSQNPSGSYLSQRDCEPRRHVTTRDPPSRVRDSQVQS